MAAPKSPLATGAPSAAPTPSSTHVPLAPFLIGTAVGGLVGAIAGTLLANATRRLLFWLVQLVGRRLSDADRDRLRFELLLQ
ncbi:MAG: hypothetical protein H0V24_00145 [Chloroflexia bacterium]|nr:hypothetical protein [Chloroflexia bacterium]